MGVIKCVLDMVKRIVEKMIGNAVPVNLAYEIVVAIKLHLEGRGNEVIGISF